MKRPSGSVDELPSARRRASPAPPRAPAKPASIEALIAERIADEVKKIQAVFALELDNSRAVSASQVQVRDHELSLARRTHDTLRHEVQEAQRRIASDTATMATFKSSAESAGEELRQVKSAYTANLHAHARDSQDRLRLAESRIEQEAERHHATAIARLESNAHAHHEEVVARMKSEFNESMTNATTTSSSTSTGFRGPCPLCPCLLYTSPSPRD